MRRNQVNNQDINAIWAQFILSLGIIFPPNGCRWGRGWGRGRCGRTWGTVVAIIVRITGIIVRRPMAGLRTRHRGHPNWELPAADLEYHFPIGRVQLVMVITYMYYIHVFRLHLQTCIVIWLSPWEVAKYAPFTKVQPFDSSLWESICHKSPKKIRHVVGSKGMIGVSVNQNGDGIWPAG